MLFVGVDYSGKCKNPMASGVSDDFAVWVQCVETGEYVITVAMGKNSRFVSK